MSDPLEILDEFEQSQGFVVDTLAKAEWCMRTIAHAQTEIERFTLRAAARKQEIDNRLADITQPHRNTIEAMKAMLEPWTNLEVAKAHGRKSIKLLAGVAGFRKSPGSLEVNDEEKAIAWLEEHGDLACVKVEKTVRKKETKELIERTGELPDGMMLKPGNVTFYVEPIVKLEGVR